MGGVGWEGQVIAIINGNRNDNLIGKRAVRNQVGNDVFA
jgi:hypothetical protein